jgi:hypothetical protein
VKRGRCATAAQLEQQPAEGVRGSLQRGPPPEPSASCQLGREMPARCLASQVGFVLPAEHAVCLVHVASVAVVDVRRQAEEHA